MCFVKPNKWLSLNDNADMESIKADIITERMRKQTLISQDLAHRCQEVIEQGEADNYTESLDYYVTARVKHAYLCMNLESLDTRLAEVRGSLTALAEALIGPTRPVFESLSCRLA